jgi:predicted nucleotidyltransferase
MDRAIPQELREVLARFRAALTKLYGEGVLELTLFGSRARGDEHEFSDVDVLVVIEKLTPWDRRAIPEIAGHLWLETGFLLRPILLDGETCRSWRDQQRPLTNAIAEDGIRF